MATIEFNAFNQVTASGKLELTPNANVFTCLINPSHEGDALVPSQAVKLINTANGVPVVDSAGAGDRVFGFLALDHKYNDFSKGKLCRVASDYAVMTFVANGAISRGDNIQVNGTDIETTTGEGLGVALDNFVDDGTGRVLIRCIGQSIPATPTPFTPSLGALDPTATNNTITCYIDEDSATETFTAGDAMTIVTTSSDAFTVDKAGADDVVYGFLVAQSAYAKGEAVKLAVDMSVIYLKAGYGATEGDLVSWDATDGDMIAKTNATRGNGIVLETVSSGDIFPCLVKTVPDMPIVSE